MSLKSGYVAGARTVRSGMSRVGALSALDRWAQRSQTGTWARSLLSIHDAAELVALDVPWWTFDSSARVDAFLAGRRRARVFEWGSGASTVWLSRRAESVVAVEHDTAWAQIVEGLIGENPAVELVAMPAVAARGLPGEARSAKPGHEGLDFHDYVNVIEKVGGDFDVIVIDGRAREACLQVALPHLVEDGLLVFDNVERRRYRRAIAAAGADVEVTWTSGLTPGLPYPTRTALLRHARRDA